MQFYTSKPNHKTSKGFTLIELMVSMSIFGIVSTISVGTLLVMIDANRKAQSVSSAMSSLSFVLDNITRNVRTGYDYYCSTVSGTLGRNDSLLGVGHTKDCANGNSLIFTDSRSGARMAFRQNGTVLERRIVDSRSGNAGKSWLQVTPDNVVINTFDVTVAHAEETFEDNGDTEQPQVTLVVAGVVNAGQKTETDFNLQANVTQRVLDY